jgi:glutamyl-tRNA synthetase
VPDGRFAPSPTGPLHLGNLRTALVAWLMARSQGAAFLLRIEDLDPTRSRAEHVAGQLEDLRALGLEWDRELPRQSERGGAYEAALARLREQDLLYECFCTRAEIRQASSAPHGPLPEGFYPGTCRELSTDERRRRARGRPAALRVRAGGTEISLQDRFAGPYRGLIDDFVVRRNDGAFAYNLAVAVDDAEQGIGEVVRGRDLLETTPRQIWVQQQLGLGAIGSWAHVPLVLGGDGERLAKRHGAVTLPERAAAGQGPGEVLALLGRSLELCEASERPEPGELLARFDPGAVPADDHVLR